MKKRGWPNYIRVKVTVGEVPLQGIINTAADITLIPSRR